jgi:hypothetical protein
MGVPNRTDVGSGCVAAASRRCAPGDAGNALELKNASNEQVVRRVVWVKPAERGRGAGQGGTPEDGTGEGDGEGAWDALRRSSRGGRLLQRSARIARWCSCAETGDGGRAGDREGVGKMKAREAGGEGGDEGRCSSDAP